MGFSPWLIGLGAGSRRDAGILSLIIGIADFSCWPEDITRTEVLDLKMLGEDALTNLFSVAGTHIVGLLVSGLLLPAFFQRQRLRFIHSALAAGFLKGMTRF